MPESPQPASYAFGPFELHPSERRLLKQGRSAALNPRAFDLLLALVERAGRLVTKDDLLKRVWPGLVVEEGNLQVQVSNLRKVLGAGAIETVAGHGYRFAHEVGAATANPQASAKARLHNLPCELTTFVGRERELAEQTSRLSGTRLLTITGGGGLGKTRLSLQLAGGVVDQYADGVWLVELDSVADPQQVIAALASVLGVVGERGASLRDAVVRYLKNRCLLLILDNCEHVLAAAAELAKSLLQWAPLVKLIATSREPLHVAGEAICPLTPLSLPDARRSSTLDEAKQSAAVRLFVARAAAAQPGFELSSRNVEAVADICRRLDGIPLALELAAARIRSIPADVLAKRLDDRFRLLNTGERTAMPRHQTLRAVIDWSYDLLTAEERVLLNRLAVFAGGLTLVAAEALSQTDSIDVLDVLANLVDKSLVIADPDRDRYDMLETVRQYAQERLAESGAQARARDSHLAYFVAFAEAAEPDAIGSNQGLWFTRLDRDRDNLLAAYAWCAHAEGGARLHLRLVCSLRMFWSTRGPLTLGYELAAQGLERDQEQTRDYVRCQALFTAGVYAYYLGRSAEARGRAEASLAIARELGDPGKVSDVLALLAMITLVRAEVAKSRDFGSESLSLARRADDKMRIMQALNFLGEVDSADGKLDASEGNFTEALALARELGEHASVASTLVNLARTAVERQSLAQAARRLLEAAQIIQEAGTHHQLLLQWLAIASAMAAERGDWRRAAMMSGAFNARSKIDGHELEVVDKDHVESRIERSRTALGAAEFAEAESSGAVATDAHWLSEAHEWLSKGAA